MGLGCQWDFKGFFGLEFSQTAKNTELFICEMMPMRNLEDVIMIMMVDHHRRLDGLLLGILHQVEQLVLAGMLPRLLLTRWYFLEHFPISHKLSKAWSWQEWRWTKDKRILPRFPLTDSPLGGCFLTGVDALTPPWWWWWEPFPYQWRSVILWWWRWQLCVGLDNCDYGITIVKLWTGPNFFCTQTSSE